MKRTILSSLVAAALIIPAAAFAAPADNKGTPPPPSTKSAPKMPGKGLHKPGHPKKMQNKMGMAQKLATIETAIGIRSDQLDVWRKYTSSLMDMMAPMNGPRGEGQRKRGKMPVMPSERFLGEHIADHTIEQAKKAEVLKAAGKNLLKKLDPDQQRRLSELSQPRPRHTAPKRAPHKGTPPKGKPMQHGTHDKAPHSAPDKK